MESTERLIKCSKCHLNLPTTAFHRCSGRSSGFSAYCKKCKKKVNKTSYTSKRAEPIFTRWWCKPTPADEVHRLLLRHRWYDLQHLTSLLPHLAPSTIKQALTQLKSDGYILAHPSPHWWDYGQTLYKQTNKLYDYIT